MSPHSHQGGKITFPKWLAHILLLKGQCWADCAVCRSDNTRWCSVVDSSVLKGWCWVSQPEHWCLLGWPFCLSSSVVSGSPFRRDETCCRCLPPSVSSLPSNPPPPPTLCPSLPPFVSSSLLSPFPSLSSPSLPACHLSLPPPLLPSPVPPVVSFPAQRLAGIFSTMVTFKTECHRCLLLSHLSPLLSPLPLALASPPTPILLLQRGPSGPSAVPGREAGIKEISSVCVWAACAFCVLEEMACQVHLWPVCVRAF